MKTSWASWAFFLVLVSGLAGCGNDPASPENREPRIVGLTAIPERVVFGGSTRVSAQIADSDGDEVTVEWSAPSGQFQNPSLNTTLWTAPDSAGIFGLTVSVSDGAASAEATVQVEVGNASLTVLSEPPGAFLTLNGVPTTFRTPHTFDPLAPGPHQVTLLSSTYAYETTTAGITLTHAQSETLRFGLAPTQMTSLDLGRTDLLEIGGIAFLPNGFGFLYAGRTASGTGIFASSVLSQVTPKGVELLAGVNMAEPISISNDGSYLFFVTENDTISAVPIMDTNSDAMTDSVGEVIRLRHGHGPAASASDQLAFTLSANEPATSQVFWSFFQDDDLVGVYFGSLTNGGLPTWKPNEPFLAFSRNGGIYYTYTDESGTGPSELLAEGGFNTAPSWGPWGPKHVAYLHGENAGDLTELRLGIPLSDHQVTVVENLVDPRHMSWNRSQRAVAVSHHGGGPGIYLVTNLPIP